MRRATTILYVAICGLLAAIPVGILISRIETPDKADAISALGIQLGIDPAQVSEVFHEYGAPDFHGNDMHLFRFNYRDPDWIDLTIRRLGGTADNHSIGLGIGDRSWWTEERAQDFECYKLSATTYAFQHLWVDRDRKLVLVSLVDT